MPPTLEPTVRAGAIAPRTWPAFAGIFLVTLLTMSAAGAVLPVLPRYVTGPLGGGTIEAGLVTAAFAVTGLASRPVAGRVSDRRGRRAPLAAGAALMALAGLAYLVPAGLAGLLLARLLLGAGQGAVVTAGTAWAVDLAPRQRRGHLIGLQGLAFWGGLSLGPAIGELLLRAAGYDAVWLFAAGAPLAGFLLATQLPQSPRVAVPRRSLRQLVAPEALLPGVALSLSIAGYATFSAFMVTVLDDRGLGRGTTAFLVFGGTVVATRVFAGGLPDRVGALACAMVAAAVEAFGLATLAIAQSLGVALVGIVAVGVAFSLIFPALALAIVEQVDVERRGVAMGTFTAFFDVGFAVGGPIAGAAAALSGAAAGLWAAAALAVASLALTTHLSRRRR